MGRQKTSLEGKAMKKYTWIVALLMALGLALVGCNTGDEGSDDITYTAVADGEKDKTASTKITFTFSEEVAELAADDITLTDGSGKAKKGALTGDAAVWTLGITGVSQGDVKVTIAKDGIEAAEKTVAVHEKGAVVTELALKATTVVDAENAKQVEGDDYKLIKAAKKGSYLMLTYTPKDPWSCGAIGSYNKVNGPILHGSKANTEQTTKVWVEDVLASEGQEDLDYLVFNMWNGTIAKVVLYAVEKDIDIKPAYTTAGSTKIVIPIGGDPAGKGDLSGLDSAKILAADDTAKLVIYFDSDKAAGWGVGTLNYNGSADTNWQSTKIKDLAIDDDKKAEVSLEDIKKVATGNNGLSFNVFDTAAKAILWIELVK